MYIFNTICSLLYLWIRAKVTGTSMWAIGQEVCIALVFIVALGCFAAESAEGQDKAVEENQGLGGS